MSASKFVIDRQLTALAISYQNPDQSFVADEVFPRKPVGTENFDYTEIAAETMYALPDTTIGKRGDWPTFSIGGTKKSASTRDDGIMIPLSNKDIDQAAPGTDPRASCVQSATNILKLRRELRAATLAFTAANYPVGNKSTLAGANQFSDPTSNPLTTFMNAFDGCLIRPNNIVLGMPVWQALRVHPRLVKAIRGNDTGEGAITRAELAQLLEINQVYVGEGWANLAKPGEAVAITRLWGKHALGFYRDSSVSFASGGGVTYGLSAEYGTRVAGSDEKPRAGLRGGVEVYTGESVREVIVASAAAYFFENAVA